MATQQLHQQQHRLKKQQLPPMSPYSTRGSLRLSMLDQVSLAFSNDDEMNALYNNGDERDDNDDDDDDDHDTKNHDSMPSLASYQDSSMLNSSLSLSTSLGMMPELIEGEGDEDNTAESGSHDDGFDIQNDREVLNLAKFRGLNGSGVSSYSSRSDRSQTLSFTIPEAECTKNNRTKTRWESSPDAESKHVVAATPPRVPKRALSLDNSK